MNKSCCIMCKKNKSVLQMNDLSFHLFEMQVLGFSPFTGGRGDKVHVASPSTVLCINVHACCIFDR